jgi:hypothetical protein
MRSIAVAAVAALALVGLGGCSDGGDDLPEGFVRFEGDGFSFAHPEEWEPGSPDEEGTVVVEPPDFEAGDMRARVSISSEVTMDLGGFIPLYLSGGASSFDDWTADRQETDVDGASEAELVTVSYTDDGDPFRGLIVLGKDGEEVYALEVGAGDDEFDRGTAEAIIDSFRLG